MCTVSFISHKNKYYIVSNRDEHGSRKQALPPTVYTIHQKKIVFPKDADAGGSWIGMCENGNVCVLLNGAFHKHIPEPPYALSRGIIFLSIISSQNPLDAFSELDLLRIEPFTIVLLENGKLFECRWDGIDKHQKQLNTHHAYIWSSVTLYDPAMILQREQWFESFLQKITSPTLHDILNFHTFAGEGNCHTDLLMNRNDQMLTVSITGMEISPDFGIMEYHDLKTNQYFREKLSFVSALELS